MPKGLRPITSYNVFQDATYASGARSIAASQSAISVAFDLRQVAQEGIFSIDYTITGSGTAKIEYLLCATAGGTFVEPSAAADIASGLTSTSGTSGRDLITFEPEMAPFMKIKVTETGGAQAVVPTLWLNVQ
jgi:hypothetical protein